MKWFAVFLFLLSALSAAYSANILMVFPMPSYSHFALGHRLAEGLTDKGHKVTMIATYKKKTSYTQIYMDHLRDMIDSQKDSFYDFEGMHTLHQIIVCYQLGYLISNFTLQHPAVQEIIREKKGHYDVVILEQFLDESIAVIPYLLDAPVIYLATLGTSIWTNHFVGNPLSVSTVPNLFMDYRGKMDFKERLQNLYLYLGEEIYRRTVAFPHHDRIIHDVYPDAPSLNDLMYKQDSLILANSHISTNDPIPHVPNIIEIGGFHVEKTALPSELKRTLDEAKNGVVLFGMGSNLKVSSLPVEKKQAILRTFAKFNQTFLWKWEEDFIEGKPDNVVLGKWFPQTAVLAHPNVKAFISHGGLLSAIESITFGKPIIGIPIFGDQKLNINSAALRGYAIGVPFKELTEEKLSSALREILYNKKYREAAERSMRLMNDRLVPPLDEGVFWVEHVIRHKGTKHFRNKGMDLKWYEYEMIDVAVFLAIIFALTIFAICKIIKMILSPFRSQASQKQKAL